MVIDTLLAREGGCSLQCSYAARHLASVHLPVQVLVMRLAAVLRLVAVLELGAVLEAESAE